MTALQQWKAIIMSHLEQQTIDHDQVSDAQVALGNAISSQHHGRSQSTTEYDVLPQIQSRQAILGFQGSSLPVCQAFVIAPLLMVFIAKVLDRLIVDEAVYGARAGIIVSFVHLLPELGTPLQAQSAHAL